MVNLTSTKAVGSYFRKVVDANADGIAIVAVLDNEETSTLSNSLNEDPLVDFLDIRKVSDLTKFEKLSSHSLKGKIVLCSSEQLEIISSKKIGRVYLVTGDYSLIRRMFSSVKNGFLGFVIRIVEGEFKDTLLSFADEKISHIVGILVEYLKAKLDTSRITRLAVRPRRYGFTKVRRS